MLAACFTGDATKAPKECELNKVQIYNLTSPSLFAVQKSFPRPIKERDVRS